MRSLIFAMLALAMAVLPAGCGFDPALGYRFDDTFDSDVRTVAVPVFENTTFQTGLEVTLTEAVIKRIQSATPWRVTSERSADTVLLGAVTEAELRSLSRRRPGGLTEEYLRSMTVDFSWRDNRTGELRVARQGFRVSGAFVPSLSQRGEIGERIEIGDRQTIQELAEAIVETMRSDW